MRTAIPLALMLGGVGPLAAQTGADPRARTEACARLEGAQRQECVEGLSRPGSRSRVPSPIRDERWMLSETTSPVDYRPVIAATLWSQSASGTARLRLSIRCRGGRTELDLMGDGDIATVAVAGDDLVVTHSINRDPSIEQQWQARGSVATFKGDVVRFLRSLPEGGELGVRVSDGKSVLHEGRFMLGGLSVVRDKIATACSWPEAGAPARDQADDGRQAPRKGKAR